ncbi:hypothetical protein DKZ34_07405 [Limosilactobacillus reuteri]|nr:hypothetical protein DKZ34_07405 [Limosilactobacillus reuteri]
MGETWKIHDTAQRLNKGDNWMRKDILNNSRYLDDLRRMEEETVWNPTVLLLGCLRRQPLHNGWKSI